MPWKNINTQHIAVKPSILCRHELELELELELAMFARAIPGVDADTGSGASSDVGGRACALCGVHRALRTVEVYLRFGLF